MQVRIRTSLIYLLHSTKFSVKDGVTHAQKLQTVQKIFDVQ